MKSSRIFWIAVIGFIIGLIGVFRLITEGHEASNYNSYIPWGLWVSAYIYYIGLSAGVFMLSTLIYVFHIKKLEKLGKLALLTAIATLIAAMFSIWMDLGHPERAFLLVFDTNFTSVMSWLPWLYSTYFILLILMFWFAIRADLALYCNNPGLQGMLCRLISFGKTDLSEEALNKDTKILQIAGTIGIPLAIAFSSGVGSLFAVLGAKPFWNTGLTPIIFLVGALFSGSALLTLVTAFCGPNRGTQEHKNLMIFLGKILLGLLVIFSLFEFFEFFPGLYAAIPADADSLHLILAGDQSWIFWGLHFTLGIIIPVLLLTFNKNSVSTIAIAGFLITVTFLAVRYNIVIPGQSIEPIEGLSNAYPGRNLTFKYSPSSMEWLFFIWTISLPVLFFLVSYKLLPIVKPEETQVSTNEKDFVLNVKS